MKNINFEYYKVFYYVARYGSFTQAAKALYSNQPNVARVINLLDRNWDVSCGSEPTGEFI